MFRFRQGALSAASEVIGVDMAIALVSGAIANKPFNGGEAWIRLSWVLGLRRLGFDVYFIEQVESADAAPQHDPVWRGWFGRIARQFNLVGRAAVVSRSGQSLYGLAMDELRPASKAADLLINISGNLTVESLQQPPRTRVYIDEDPGFTHFWHAAGLPGARLAGHDFYFTLGRNVG